MLCVIMRKNNLKQIWQSGETALNGWLHIPSSWAAETLAHAGYDSLTIDFQHGFHNMESALAMLQAISTTDTVPLVRAPWNEPVLMQQMLDAGAYGVICPVIETREQCAAFVGACRYPPVGYRSKGPTRAVVYGGADYAQHANDEIVTLAMIETATGLENLDDILTVEGLDGIFVGPGDLGLSLVGAYDIDTDHPVVAEAIQTIKEKTLAAGLVVGIWCPSAEIACQFASDGFQFVTISSDARLLSLAARTSLEQVRNQVMSQAKADS